MPRMTILGVPIDALPKAEAIHQIQSMLAGTKQCHMMTPNSEMLVAASKNSEFLHVLQQSDLNLPDSQGLVWMSRLIGQKIPERVTGVDTVVSMCALLTEDHPIFLLGAAPGVAEKTALILRSHNSHLRIAGTYAGTPKDDDAADIIRRINDVKPHLLLVAYGAPAQDLWIAHYLSRMPSVKVAMGVGGTFDFIAGTRKRAPSVFQSLGLEWLWRLMREPSRYPRIFNAVIRFPLLVLRYRSAAPHAVARSYPPATHDSSEE